MSGPSVAAATTPNLNTPDASPARLVSPRSAQDLVPGASFIVSVDDIDPYDQNPRLIPNPKTEELRASILASGGLTAALSVTWRPGADRFLVHQGGNTRLKLIKELRASTPDEDRRFDNVLVQFHPFTSELDIAAFHDRENTLRGDLTFIERAFAKCRQYELYCRDHQDQKPTARAFVKYMQQGYGDPLTADEFSRMKFAVDTLYEVIPTCLVYGGMTLRAVRGLIKFREKIARVWVEHGYGNKKQFAAVFYALLRRQDEQLQRDFRPGHEPNQHYPDDRLSLDHEQLRRDLQNEMSRCDSVDASYERIGLWIAQALNEEDIALYERHADSAEPVSPELELDLRPRVAKEAELDGSSADRRNAGTPKLKVAAPNTRATPRRPLPTDIAELRRVAYDCAKRLAKRNGFDHLVLPTPNAGIGYVLADVFGEEFEDLTKPRQDALAARWWALAMCSMSTDLPIASIEQFLPGHSLLRDAQVRGQLELVYKVLGSQDIGSAGHYWALLSKEDWADFLELMSLFQAVIASTKGAKNLWFEPTAKE